MARHPRCQSRHAVQNELQTASQICHNGLSPKPARSTLTFNFVFRSRPLRALIIIGFLAGIGSVAAVAYTTPFLEQQRIHSETRVVPNGGRLEKFEIRVEQDLLSNTPGLLSESTLFPASANWFPERAPFGGDVQVFRLRNVNSQVVGTGIRHREAELIEWVLHLPARGTMVLQGTNGESLESGVLALGLREFENLDGIWEARMDEDGVMRFDTVVRAAEYDEEAGA